MLSSESKTKCLFVSPNPAPGAPYPASPLPGIASRPGVPPRMQAAGLGPPEHRGSPFQATNHTRDDGTRPNATLRELLPAVYSLIHTRC